MAMDNEQSVIPIERIEKCIFSIRGHKVMLDADLAELYGVETKRLNEQVKRNRKRFPEDFFFQLTAKEKIKVVATCDRLRRLKFSTTLPYAFTEYGAVMLATILSSPMAIQASIHVVRTFIYLRTMLVTNKELASKLKVLEKKYNEHDMQIKQVFDAIRQLMAFPESTSKRRIGFRQSKESNVSDRGFRAKGS